MEYILPDTSTEFYAALEAALSYAPDYVQVYKGFKDVFLRLIEQNTASVRIVFRGPYPKTDYLLKQHGAPWLLRKRVHDTRIRLRRLTEVTAQHPEELEARCLYDLRNLSEFVTLLYGEPIPARLQHLFPHDTEGDEVQYQAFADSVRMIVTRSDEAYFYGTIETQETPTDICVSIACAGKDWTYLREMLTPGAQVNLVRPAWADNGKEIVAEIIVYEPDYLVDVSSIAGCFEPYAQDAVVGLLKKIKPNTPTLATLLGNLASEVLDKTLHATSAEGINLRHIANRFMQNNAMAMAALDADARHTLWNDIQVQARNIHEALNVFLPEAMGDAYQPHKVITEPTFFSEMLGIQGRMDFFQTDGSLVLEQKSGKGAYIPGDTFETPRASAPHIVQLTLYIYIIRYAFRHAHEHETRDTHSFLLYSKYAQSLYSQGYNPGALLHTALKIRNQIAWREQQYAEGGAFRQLGTLTADEVNKTGVNGVLWQRYQRPAIDTLLHTIQSATEVEQAYVFRMLEFAANEHMLTKVGNKIKENSGFASKWYDTLDDKLSAGNIYAGLRLERASADQASDEGDRAKAVEVLHFTFQETETGDMANFRTGDIVVAYAYDEGTEPDIRRNMVFRCSIERIEADSIALRLRAPQSSTYVFERDKDRPWAIEHDFFESSFSTLYRGIYAFLEAPAERRDLLLMQRQPRVDTSATTLASTVSAQFQDLVLRAKQAQDFFLIIGPPGTGKTSFGIMTVLTEELAQPDATVLLMSYTNRAVDEICDKLIEAGVDFVKIGNSLSSSTASRPYLLSERVQSMPRVDDVLNLIRKARVFVGTTTSLSGQQMLFQHKQFSLAIIDEASQILEPHLLPLLSAKHNGEAAIRRFVMIGDHKQLPAVVQQTPEVSAVQDEILHAIGLTDCRLSLFERLLRRYGQDPAVTYMLTRQGRMHPDVAAFVNHMFYADRLDVVPLPHQQRALPTDVDSRDGLDRLLATRRLSFLAVRPVRPCPSDKVNKDEAELIAALVLRIYSMHKQEFDPLRTVGVIVPYRNQIATVRTAIMRSGIEALSSITIDTVERYQGSQRRFIVYGFTVSRKHQLRFLCNNVFLDVDGALVDRKLNVAMTRAEESLVLVGNPELLSMNITFSRLIEYVHSKQGYFDAPVDDLIDGRFEVPPQVKP